MNGWCNISTFSWRFRLSEKETVLQALGESQSNIANTTLPTKHKQEEKIESVKGSSKSLDHSND
jgi:hypothetical protein